MLVAKGAGTEMLQHDTQWEIQKAAKRGARSLFKPVPLSLCDWAEQNFYLSAESSYVEGRFEAFPFQRALLGCISNDDIRDVTFKKSARVGATKCILAAIGYFAEHKKRNQAVWQPTDSDSDSFVKNEIDPMLRDVDCMRDIFPWREMKHKNNTMNQKSFVGSTLHVLGGKAAKNYRRISIDVGYIDELSGFDANVEQEGPPDKLAKKRVEGAVFPKMVYASTPKIDGACLITKQHEKMEIKVSFKFPCPECGEMEALEWGGPDCDYGFKWEKDRPETVAYLCKHCACLFDQGTFLEVWDKGRWEDEDGGYLDDDGHYYTIDGVEKKVMSVGFHVWTGYSPMTEWETIAREFLSAKHNPNDLQGFVNLTLGETWTPDQGKSMDRHVLAERKEYYDAEVPDDVVILTLAADTQDDRVEWGVKGWAASEESWWIDYQVQHGDPSQLEFWEALYRRVKRTYKKADGTVMDIKLMTIDSGGHFTSEVYAFCQKSDRRWAIPTKGQSIAGKPIITFPKTANRSGVYLTMIGTDSSKNVTSARLTDENEGSATIHFPHADWCDDSFFKQMTAEKLQKKYDKTGRLVHFWHCPHGRRNEVFDIENLNLAAIRILQQHYGIDLELLSERNANSVPVMAGPMVRKRRMISRGIE